MLHFFPTRRFCCVEVVFGQGFVWPFVTVDDFRDSAVGLPRPAVIFAEEAGGVAAAFGDRPAAVRADIVIGLDLVGSDADHDDRLVDDVIGVEIADIGDFLFAAGHLPDAIPQFFGFDLREFGRDIMVGSDDIATAVLLQSVLGLNVHTFPLLGPFGVLIGLAFATSLARRSIYLSSN